MQRKCTGRVVHILYKQQEVGNYYTVAMVQPEGAGPAVKCVGQMPGIYEDAIVSVSGDFGPHPSHGMQLSVSDFSVERPQEEAAIVEYLSRGLIHGIGRTLAEAVTNHFHAEVYDVLDNHPERLLEVRGIGAKRRAAIEESWKANRSVSELLIALQQSLSVGKAFEIVERYGSNAKEIILKDPYRLIRDFDGISFAAADKIAMRAGVDPLCRERIIAAASDSIRRGQDVGHVYLPEDVLFRNVSSLLRGRAAAAGAPAVSLPRDAFLSALSDGADEGVFVMDDNRVYLPPFFRSEVRIASSVAGRLRKGAALRGPDISAIEEKTGVKYDESQKAAIARAMSSGVFVLTGGPGTGKTVTIGGIIEAFRMIGKSVSVAAPTGRASKRVSEATGEDAVTIHKLLEYNGSVWGRNADNELECDVLIIDESSMVSMSLMEHVLEALPFTSVLILTGDADQLPAIGAGDIFNGLIRSGCVPFVRLQYIHRQGSGSVISGNAHLVNSGGMVRSGTGAEDRFRFVHASSDHDILALFEQYLSVETHADAMRRSLDIQVLCPTKKNILGTVALNSRIQELVNPPCPDKPELRVRMRTDDFGKNTVFRLGDRVIQTKNDYMKGVFNGDIGFISSIDMESQKLCVDFSGVQADYDVTDMEQLQLAYAVSVHKSQGSEYRTVIMPVGRSCPTQLLKRKLLYTAITRAKKEMILFADPQTVGTMVRNNTDDTRYTYLPERILEAFRRGLDDPVPDAV